LQVWAATHPVPACKTGAAEVLQKLPEVWPKGKAANKAELQALKICGDCEGASLCTGAGHTDAIAALAGAMLHCMLLFVSVNSSKQSVTALMAYAMLHLSN
jgi:hypothetical protein